MFGLISGGIMAELEIRVVSLRREGLLVELGRIVYEYGYALLRRRLTQEAQGVSLTMVLRGPDERRLALEDALGTHPGVLSFESVPYESASANRAAFIAGAKNPAASERVSAATFTPIASGADIASVERVLPNLAREYPSIFPLLISLGRALHPEARGASLYLAGRRTGRWVYRRDFELGARLALADAIKRVVLPALRKLVATEMDNERLHIRNCPLCQTGGESGGRFFCGFIEGLLAEPVASPSLFVRETSCHGDGAAVCIFEISC
jgi:predicted hydrocarbon binding protein